MDITPFRGIDREHSGALPEELTEVLLSQNADSVRIERIVSRGHSSPDGFWYDQEEHEWVLVLSGSGSVEFEEPPLKVCLERGDALLIPAHKRHRVASTDPVADTVWLAVFWHSDSVS